MDFIKDTPLIRLQLILSGINDTSVLGNSDPLLDPPDDSLAHMDRSVCNFESFITHTRNGLLRSPADTPKDEDVLLGRGKCFQFRMGNVRFRDRINVHSKPYEKANKSQKAAMLHEMYDDLRSVGRFLKYDHVTDEFMEATKEEVMRKISQAIQYQKRTKIPEEEKRKIPKCWFVGQKHGVGNNETKGQGKPSLSSSIRNDVFNQWIRQGICLNQDEAILRTTNKNLTTEILRDQGHRCETAKYGDNIGVARAALDTSRSTVLPSMASMNANWSLKPSFHNFQGQPSGKDPSSKPCRPLDYDRLVSDAIDAVLGERQTDMPPSYETMEGFIQSDDHD